MTKEEFKKNVQMMLVGCEMPSDEELQTIYNTIQKHQIKALNSVDLVAQNDIYLDLWEFVHKCKDSRKDI